MGLRQWGMNSNGSWATLGHGKYYAEVSSNGSWTVWEADYVVLGEEVVSGVAVDESEGRSEATEWCNTAFDDGSAFAQDFRRKNRL